ncbi:hypothetical protein LI328DRAFT_137798 [Trichoderma asperelloides]|nr:hypothetical protein LI328DRAFT_137798 [Trichoderma asperelloides]
MLVNLIRAASNLLIYLWPFFRQILAVVEIKLCRSHITVDFTMSDRAYTVQQARSGDASYCSTQYLSTKASRPGYMFLYPSLLASLCLARE